MPPLETSPQQDEILTVGAFTRRIKSLLEGELPPTWVRGEISNLRRQQSGHVYFTLKDDQSQLPCVLFRGDALRQRTDLEDGRQVIALGSLSVYEPHGRYQMICRLLVEDGAGRLQEAFERLKQKLAAEGLFDPERKRTLPLLPHTIGIVTSPSGAALRDFLSILERRRWRGCIRLFPAKVQGAGAADEIVRQIAAAQAEASVELLVVGRGGGSLEDLWPFNEEAVARAVAACRIPVISAVGHEIDFTLTDFAADRRAETPSAAAELISSQFLQCEEQVEAFHRSLRQQVDWQHERLIGRLGLLRERLRGTAPQERIERSSLRLDDLSGRLYEAARDLRQRQQEQLGGLAQRLALATPERHLEKCRWQKNELARRFQRLMAQPLKGPQEHLAALQQRMDNSSLPRTLARGFVTVRDLHGKIVTRGRALKPGDRLAIDFKDGEVHAEVRKLPAGEH